MEETKMDFDTLMKQEVCTNTWLQFIQIWERLTAEQQIEVLRKYIDIVDWYAISRVIHAVNERFVREFYDFIVWKAIDTTVTFSDDFIREFRDELDMKHRIVKWKLKREFGQELPFPCDFLN